MLTTSNKLYVSYFSSDNKFNHNDIKTNLECTPILKPKCAFWGSPLNAKFGWKDWCIYEDFGDYDFDHPIQWKLKDGSKILNIDMDAVKNPNSILYNYVIEDEKLKMFKETLGHFYPIKLDFQKMKDNRIDAVELLDSSIGHSYINYLESAFNGWDCESIVVLNPSKIEFF